VVVIWSKAARKTLLLPVRGYGARIHYALSVSANSWLFPMTGLL